MTTGKRYVLTFVIVSLGYIVLGLVLLIAPETSQHIICYILGGVAAVLGIIRIAMHFSKGDLSRAFQNDIPVGVVLIIAGVYLFAQANLVAEWLPVLLGFAVVFDSMIKLQHSFDLKRAGFGPWWVVLAVSLVTTVLGVLLIINVFGELPPYFFGGILIFDAAVNIITIILFTLQLRQAHGTGKQDTNVPATRNIDIADED